MDAWLSPGGDATDGVRIGGSRYIEWAFASRRDQLAAFALRQGNIEAVEARRLCLRGDRIRTRQEWQHILQLGQVGEGVAQGDCAL